MKRKVFHVTAEGKRDLEQELKDLIAQRPAIADEIATARAQGDLSENAEYTSAREHQTRVEGRIADIEEILKNVEIIESDGDGTVSMGDTVTVECGGARMNYQLVGAIEADPMSNKISNESPLGAALMGKHIGETVSIDTPKGKRDYLIVSLA